MMRIAFMIPSGFFLSGPGNGIVAQAKQQANALRELGVEVDLINPWEGEKCKVGAYDVLHYFYGGYGLYGIHSINRKIAKKIIFSPIIDSNQSNFTYGFAAKLGVLLPHRINTIPGEFRRQAMAADAVIVRSKHEYERVEKGLGIPADKIHIVLNGVSPATEWTDEVELRNNYSLPEKFVFHVSAWTQPRKNVRRLIDALDTTGINLVLAGSQGHDAESVEIVQYAKSKPYVTILGFLSKNDLWGMYRICEIFALPSIHEGTGLVGLEAASMGAKVVVTNRGGTADYFSEFAELVDPFSIRDIKRGLIIASNSNAHKFKLDDFSWARCSMRLVSIYERYGGAI